MAYDPRAGVVLLYGGGTRASGTYRELDDFWMWDGTSWKEVPATPGLSPGARVGHAMTFDASRGRVVLYGGSRGRTILADLWEWDGEKWREMRSTSHPPATTMAADTIPLTFESDGAFTVRVGYYQHGLSSASWICRGRRIGNAWKVESCRLQWIS